MTTKTLCIDTWTNLDKEIKSAIFRNGYFDSIKESVKGELNELMIKTSFGCEVLFCGNGEACITVDVNGVDYEFVYLIDRIGFNEVLVNF